MEDGGESFHLLQFCGNTFLNPSFKGLHVPIWRRTVLFGLHALIWMSTTYSFLPQYSTKNWFQTDSQVQWGKRSRVIMLYGWWFLCLWAVCFCSRSSGSIYSLGGVGNVGIGDLLYMRLTEMPCYVVGISCKQYLHPWASCAQIRGKTKSQQINGCEVNCKKCNGCQHLCFYSINEKYKYNFFFRFMNNFGLKF